MVVLWLFLMQNPRLHCLSMGACHRMSKEGLSNAGKGSSAPRGRPPLDRGPLPLPSHGRPWARPRLLHHGVLP
jgi:hypothetical protein